MSILTQRRQMREGNRHERQLVAPPKLSLKVEEIIVGWLLDRARNAYAVAVD